jgi:catechol 2,3-dioxygenase-like lactoylglutathione lyase family enzyme
MAPGAHIHHFGMTVSDLDASVAFYTKHFDLARVDGNDITGDVISRSVGLPDVDMTTCLLAGANTIFELIGYRSPSGVERPPRNCDVGACHPCFAVDDIDAIHDALVADGVTVSIPPQDFGATKFFFFLDPDGISVEVIQIGGDLGVAPLMEDRT